MGVPLYPLAAAYGLGLGHLAGHGFYNRFMAPSAGGGTLTRWNHPSQTVTIKGDPSTATQTRTMNRYRRFTRTRRTKRKRRFGRGLKNPVPTLWPRTRLVKFRVVTKFATGDNEGDLGQYVLKANSLNDPHGTAGTNLPLGLDQYAAMYSKYAVVSSRHFVKVHNGSSTGAVVYGLTLRHPGENSLLATDEAYLEHPVTKSRILSPDMDHSGVGVTYNTKRYWGIRKFKDAEDHHATFSTAPGDPTKLAYVSFWFADVAGAQSYNIEGYITTEYTVLLFDPILPARSSL